MTRLRSSVSSRVRRGTAVALAGLRRLRSLVGSPDDVSLDDSGGVGECVGQARQQRRGESQGRGLHADRQRRPADRGSGVDRVRADRRDAVPRHERQHRRQARRDAARRADGAAAAPLRRSLPAADDRRHGERGRAVGAGRDEGAGVDRGRRRHFADSRRADVRAAASSGAGPAPPRRRHDGPAGLRQRGAGFAPARRRGTIRRGDAPGRLLGQRRRRALPGSRLLAAGRAAR